MLMLMLILMLVLVIGDGDQRKDISFRRTPRPSQITPVRLKPERSLETTGKAR